MKIPKEYEVDNTPIVKGDTIYCKKWNCISTVRETTKDGLPTGELFYPVPGFKMILAVGKQCVKVKLKPQLI